MQWSVHWWIFPLACVVMMAVMFLFMTGFGGMRCAQWMRRIDEPRSRDEAQKPSSGPSSGGGSARPSSTGS